MPRSYIRDFSLYNPAYINATVAFYTVEDGARTETLAPLYAGSTGSAQAENPQRLGSRGILQNPVYHEDPVIAVVTSEGQPSHTTGIIRNVEADADRAETAADAIELAYASFEEIETARDDAQTAATTAQAAAAGIKWKNSVKAATTADITLSGEQTIDGIALVAGDRCLVKNQSDASENGIYQVSASAWSRTFDLDDWLEIPSASVSVEEGSTNADTSWNCTADQGGTLETTDINWALINLNNTYSKDQIDTKDAAKLSLSGGTMTGDIELKGDATSDLHPITKQQFDAATGSVYSERADSVSTATPVVHANTPEITDGVEVFSVDFTPSKIGAIIEAFISLQVNVSAAANATFAVFVDGETDAIFSRTAYVPGDSYYSNLEGLKRFPAPTADEFTVSVRLMKTSAAASTVYLNSSSAGGPMLGGTVSSSVRLQEIPE